MTLALEDKLGVGGETWLHLNLETLSIDHTALRLSEHALAGQIDFFDSAVEELVEFAFERYHDVRLTTVLIDLLKLGLLGRINRLALNVRVLRAKECFKDFEVVSLIDVASELVNALGDTMLETVLAILVIDAFHKRVGQHLISFANSREVSVCLCFSLPRVTHGMVHEGKLAVG